MKILLLFTLSSCSLFGINDEKGPKYKVLKSEGSFEVREYQSYIIAKTTVPGDFNEASSKAFKILAGYIFGKNKGEKGISMTSPVEIEQESIKISMTSPVTMTSQSQGYTMAFSMPEKYTLATLPEPIDERISFEEVPAKLVATHQFTWWSNQEKNKRKADELRKWTNSLQDYQPLNGHKYAGYNPPWTIPFLRRNEVMIELQKRTPAD